MNRALCNKGALLFSIYHKGRNVMKKLLCILSMLLTAVMIVPLTATAAESESDDIYAVATTESGSEITLADAPDAEEMGDLLSYDLMIDNDPVLSVEQSDVPDPASGTANNGYFSADFLLPDTTKQVFLTGLTAEKVEEIQQRIIKAFASGADFELEDLSFIDAEKKYPDNDGDDYLCWAATASNMLTYTGWAAQADRGFSTTDDVFEDFIGAFSDEGSSIYYGLGWFFNGVNTFNVAHPDWNPASATAGTGGYLTDYAYDMAAELKDITGNGVGGMAELWQSLRDGDGVGLSVTVYYQGQEYGGHAITCWGSVTDTAYSAADEEYYSGLFITDSDSDQPRSGDRRSAKNILQSVSLTRVTDDNGALTYEFDLDSNNHCRLKEFCTLKPYSADLPKETDAAATRSKVAAPDLMIEKICLGSDVNGSSDYEISTEKIESNTAFFYTPMIINEADVSYSSATRIAITITDADGNTAYTRTLNTSLSIGAAGRVSYVKSLTHNGLSEGDYTLTVTLNSDHTVSEAYYYNNTFSYPFKVRDSYLLGDTDDSGQVDIMDATKTQRILAGYTGETDERASERSRISGDKLNIMDATQIQMHLAGFLTNYPIAEKKLYD